MIDLGSRFLALIPARGGSKGIKDKNIRPLAGKPLISHTIEEAKKFGGLADIFVSTDSEKIAECARKHGADVPFLRDAKTAGDTAKMEDMAREVISRFREMGRNYEIIMLLQPTSPMRKFSHMKEALELFQNLNLKGLASVNIVKEHPLFLRSMDKNNRFTKLLAANSCARRQDIGDYFFVNGAIYINRASDIMNKDFAFNENEFGYLMDRDSSVDINELADLHYCEYLMKEKYQLES